MWFCSWWWSLRHGSGWPGTCYVAKDNFELRIDHLDCYLNNLSFLVCHSAEAISKFLVLLHNELCIYSLVDMVHIVLIGTFTESKISQEYFLSPYFFFTKRFFFLVLFVFHVTFESASLLINKNKLVCIFMGLIKFIHKLEDSLFFLILITNYILLQLFTNVVLKCFLLIYLCNKANFT